jgi:hypothetical protein
LAQTGSQNQCAVDLSEQRGCQVGVYSPSTGTCDLSLALDHRHDGPEACIQPATTIAAADAIASSGGLIATPSSTAFLAAGDKISLQGLQTTGASVDVPAAVLSVLLQRKGTR